MQYDMRPDRLGWTLFDVTSGRSVVWDDVPLTGIEQEAAHDYATALSREHAVSLAASRQNLSAGRVRTASRTRVQARFSLTRVSLE